MKYLGIDYGAKRVGAAVSDRDATIAFPRAVFQNDTKLLSELMKIVQEERIESIVVGDTRSHGGGENPVTVDAEAFVEILKTKTKLPVESVPEVWSSIEANRYAPKGEEHNDAAAAAFILQRFLDMKG